MTVRRCAFAGRDHINFLPNKHHSNLNVNLSPSLLLEEPHYLFSLWFEDLCGNLVWKSLGQAGEIEPETEGILTEYGVDFSDFSSEVLECLPQGLPWTVPPEELSRRRDLR